jgi:hypothetical protein
VQTRSPTWGGQLFDLRLVKLPGKANDLLGIDCRGETDRVGFIDASLIVSAMLSTPRSTHIVQHESMLLNESIGNVIEERAKLRPCVLIEGGFPLEDLHGSLEFSRASTCGRDGQRHLR